MSKYEFLDGLKKALASTNDQRLINENYEFYRNYIEEELKKQRSEEEIMQELGDPRLIAHSIKEAAGIDDEFAYEEEAKTFYNTYSEGSRQNEETDYDRVKSFRNFRTADNYFNTAYIAYRKLDLYICSGDTYSNSGAVVGAPL